MRSVISNLVLTAAMVGFTLSDASASVLLFQPSIDNINFSQSLSSAVPEPSTFSLLGLGGLGLTIVAYRRRRSISE